MKTKLLLLRITLPITSLVNSQNKKSDLEKTIYHHDSIFWKGYNSCGIPIFKKYVTEDF